ncbi:hypothetical protein D3Z39_07340 [Anaerotruncus colihominis]|uniref:Uncharacterized protein n=1 Tax=Anaerotruncus colihominis TaxID=169435 RepID=A0A845RGD0_9FIRM|nr:hypothetical protein [Anaerotruncus colihominis]
MRAPPGGEQSAHGLRAPPGGERPAHGSRAPARPAGRKTLIQAQTFSPAKSMTDAARLARILQDPTV